MCVCKSHHSYRMQICESGLTDCNSKGATKSHEVLESYTRYSDHLAFAVGIMPMDAVFVNFHRALKNECY